MNQQALQDLVDWECYGCGRLNDSGVSALAAQPVHVTTTMRSANDLDWLKPQTPTARNRAQAPSGSCLM